MRPIDGDYISDALEAELCREGDDLEDRQWAYGYAAGVSFAVRKLAEAPTLTPPNEWVSVEDSIPCSGKRVLATDGSFVGEAWYASFSKSWYRNNGFEWDRICGQVTHWMPLPAPPKKEHDHE